jgi:high affinity sulfate transporter 1
VPKLAIASWIHGYDKSNLKFDIIAGLSVWALVVPQSIAYAHIAGLPPQAGVFCSFAAPLGYALFGTSRQLIVSPTSATAAISASLVAPLALGSVSRYADLSMTLAILSGLLFILLGYWKLGFVSQFIATSVQVGFLFGLGMTIICGQVFDLLGIDSVSGPFYKQFWGLITHLDETNGWTAVIGIGGLIAIFALKRFAPGVPAALLLVGVAIVVVSVFSLEDHGVAIVGQIDRAIPLPGIPTDIKFSDLATLLPGTLAIVIIGYSESISIAEGFADEHKYDVKPNRELTALGISAVLSGLFKGFIAGGGASQSAANDRAGARTQFAGVVLALLAALTSIALMPIFKNLPSSILAAIVIGAVVGFLNVRAMKRLRALRKGSFVFALMALGGVLILGILPGLLITAGLSVLLLLGWESRPQTSVLGRIPGTTAFASTTEVPTVELEPDWMIFRLDAPLLFINASWMRDALREELAKRSSPPEVVLLDLSLSFELDVKGLDILAKVDEYVREQGGELWLARAHHRVRDMLDRGEAIGTIKKIPRYLTIDDAANAYRARRSAASATRGSDAS